jgi:hypothetical protein
MTPTPPPATPITEVDRATRHVAGQTFSFDHPTSGDPMNVVLMDYAPGQGRILITYWGTAWTAYWPAMGKNDIAGFFLNCDVEYLVSNLCSNTMGIAPNARIRQRLEAMVRGVKVGLERRLLELQCLPPEQSDLFGGITRAALERANQIHRKGYGGGHDLLHDKGELAAAAIAHLHAAANFDMNRGLQAKHGAILPIWPFQEPFKSKDDRLEHLAIAAAFCAAEIDRIRWSRQHGLTDFGYDKFPFEPPAATLPEADATHPEDRAKP